ncbi:MAG: sulfatase-like hydrolase/transferase [Acetobacteraceae bacterium]|nr:sulfatase-like hydrolase/transferase [Acetobacteraceae bacterium]
MNRRVFVKGAGAASASFVFGPGIFDGGHARAQSLHQHGSVPGRRPNILVIEVDELRFPSVFPSGINDVAGFLQQFMPNLYQLWQNGVKFANHYAAASACTPARGTIISGLYSEQSWLVQTILATPYNQISLQPWLNPAYPTYGKLLRRVGYQTPYIGKWHVSIPRQDTPRLEEYGFDGLTYYDPTGANLQGTYGDHPNGYLNDQDIATQGVQWLQQHYGDEAPWCLTVSFVNPHDKEFFWAGTEFQTYNGLFTGQSTSSPSPTTRRPITRPTCRGMRTRSGRRSRSAIRPFHPTGSQRNRSRRTSRPCRPIAGFFQGLVWGGAAEDPGQQGFTIQQYPPNPYPPISGVPLYGIGTAPFSYWQRNLDSYTQIMTIVDGVIGQVLQALAGLPSSVVQNTVIVFLSDHGEYAGAHGFLSGKVGSLYDEAYHVPLIVVDPSGRFTADIETPRQGLTSSVDLVPLLASIGRGGSRAWLRGNLGEIYRARHDLLPMLQSSQAPGRQYVLCATDESVPGYYNFNNSPGHLLCMRTQELKFGIYANWVGVTAQIDNDNTLETELYDYSTEAGRAELDNLQDDPRIPALKNRLLNEIIPNEFRAPLPGALGTAQTLSQIAYLTYDALIRNISPSGSNAGNIRAQLPFGRDF